MALVELLGSKVQGKNGDVDVASLEKLDMIGIYFSAHWCPPCRAFTPVLAQRYNTIKAKGGQLEIIFASSDRDEASFADYYKDMPWLAIPFGDEKKDELSSKYGIRGIPTLVLVNPKNGEVISMNGRGHLGNDENGDNFPNYKD